jgi:acetyl-CoA carboxylase biotin carboxyl carrier protein
MTIDEIKDLIRVVNDSGIAELEVQRGDNRVRIRRSNLQPAQEILLAPASAPIMAAPASLPAGAPPPPPSPPAAGGLLTEPAAAPEPDNLTYVRSPIVGTYYDAPSPGSATFVKIGDRVSPGQTLCIIESMKLMNEIECEISGVIISKLVENGRPVEYGESLFAVQPL